MRIYSRYLALVYFFLAAEAYATEPLPNVPGQSETYDKEYADCQDIDGYLVTPPEWKQPQYPPQESAVNAFSPLWIPEPPKPKGISWRDWALKLSVKITELEAPKHGKVKVISPEWYSYMFMPDLGYLGPDRAVYEIEIQGRRYKRTINFWVMDVVTWLRGAGEQNPAAQACWGKKFEGLECLNRARSDGVVREKVRLQETGHETSRIFRVLSPGTRVRVPEQMNGCFTVAGRTGQWVEVIVMDDGRIRKGWIFDAYIDYE